MAHLLALALLLSLLACAALDRALVTARRSAAQRAEAASAVPSLPPGPAEAAMVEALCQDIRARTNGIVGLAELLVAAPLPDDQLRQAELIIDSGRTLLRLLADVLDVTRIDTGGLRLQEEPSDLRDLLGHSVNLMQASARTRGLSLMLLVDDAVPPQVVVDRTRLRQVLLNLIGNAVKFTRRGQIDVQARLAQTPAGPQVAISVVDPGVGIARERQAEIFQPFFHQPVPTGGPGGVPSSGTGLGLALSGRIVRAMGGEIALESAPGLGSCFTVRLPLVTPSGHLAQLDRAEPATVMTADPVRLQELESRYLQRKDALFASLRAVVSGPIQRTQETDWESLAIQLHRFSGVAANFGDGHLGVLARQLHGELHGEASPRLRHEALLRHWDALQAARGT